MKKICLLLLFCLSFVILFPNIFYAYDTGSNNYGTEIDGYTRFYTHYIYEKGTRIPVFIGGTDTYTYYTYYVYEKLRIDTDSLNDNCFEPVTNNEVIGSYENVLINIQHEYTMSSTIGYSLIKDAGIGITFENHQSWDYTYSEGEEAIFNVTNSNGLASVAVIQIKMLIIERIHVVEKKYGGFSGNQLISTTVTQHIHNPYEFIIDYDLVPVFYDQLTYAEKSNFQQVESSYKLKLINSYVPNFNYEYYSMIPSDIRSSYYYNY